MTIDELVNEYEQELDNLIKERKLHKEKGWVEQQAFNTGEISQVRRFIHKLKGNIPDRPELYYRTCGTCWIPNK
jgi:hypothetical protein